MPADEHTGEEAGFDKKLDAPDAAATAVVTPRKNTVGLISLICGIAAAVFICVGSFGSGRIHHREMSELMKMAEDRHSIGKTPTPDEERAIWERHQERWNKIKEETVLYQILEWFGWPGRALILAALVLGIIGVKRKDASRNAAVAGLTLGIGLTLVMLCLMFTL